jgi:hypothetical protein
VSAAGVVADCSVTEARALTDRIKAGLDELWALLLEAHDRRAWQALGYDTWEAYVGGEFAMSRRHSYRLLDQGRVIREIGEATGPVWPMGHTPVSEREARDIKGQIADVVDDVREEVEALGPDPEPEQVQDAVKDVVRKRRSWARPRSDAAAAGAGLAKPLEPADLPDRSGREEPTLPLEVRRVDGKRAIAFASPALPGWTRSVPASDPIAVAKAVSDALAELQIAAYASQRAEPYDLAHLAPAPAEAEAGRRWPDPWHPSLWTPLPDGTWRSPKGRIYRANSQIVGRVIRTRRELGLPVVAPAAATG